MNFKLLKLFSYIYFYVLYFGIFNLKLEFFILINVLDFTKNTDVTSSFKAETITQYLEQ